MANQGRAAPIGAARICGLDFKLHSRSGYGVNKGETIVSYNGSGGGIGSPLYIAGVRIIAIGPVLCTGIVDPGHPRATRTGGIAPHAAFEFKFVAVGNTAR